MSTGFTVGFDCTHANLAATVRAVPAGSQLAGYVTGSPDIAWTAADWHAHPDAIRIDQSPANTAADETADVLDVEAGAGTLADCAPWAKAALASFARAARPGQRRPAIYASAGNITNVVNALVAGAVTSGVGLWVANWNLTQAQAVLDVLNASGPYPVIGVQFTDAPGFFDADIFSTAWLHDRSGTTPPVPRPGSGTQPGWRWCRKCRSLFFGPQQAQSHCAAGGTHDGTGSYDYALPWTRP